MSGDTPAKYSYTVPCTSSFRDAILRLAAARRVNVADLARSALLLLPKELVEAQPDPGEPGPDDRETIILKSGPANGRPWRRKPRLQIRMPEGYSISAIRRALGLILAIEERRLSLSLDGQSPAPPEDPAPAAEINEEMDRLRTIVSLLAFEPLPHGVRNRADALHVMGFPPSSLPDARTVKARFRMLATIHHPDAVYGDHHRMSQLNAAMELLQRGV